MLSDSVPTPHSCQNCQKLVLDTTQASSSADFGAADRKYGQRVEDWLKSVLPESISRRSTRWNLIASGIVIFDFTLAEAREAANERCSLCISILGHGQPGTEDKGESSFLAARVDSSSVHFGVPYLRSVKDGAYFISVEPYRQNSYCTFQLIATTENVASKEIFIRPINDKQASEESFNLARGWRHTCIETHPMCPKPRGDFMPTRLIEILQKRGHRYLCLRETTSGGMMKVEPYAALSYCWGGEQYVTTSTKTIQRHLVRINMRDLPATLRDAILVTEKLGIYKVWIDALCIIQDDIYDKAMEIAQMPSVYSGASVTIAASRATSVQDGFLQDRSCMANEAPGLTFKLPYRCRGSEIGSVLLIPPIKEAVEPLDRRAWSLQEHLLSPRILEYGSLQLRWICQQNKRLGALTDGFKDSRVSTPERSEDLFTTALELILSQKVPLDVSAIDRTEYILGRWRGLVEAYTHRTLTFPGDRILGISGIASRFGRILRGDYCAGLWKSSLTIELFWQFHDHPELTPRPSEYQGPSWSWTAINSPVSFDNSGYWMDAFLEILDCQTELQSRDMSSAYSDTRFGAVVSGFLKVRGRILPAEWLRSDNILMPMQDRALRLSGTKDQDDILPAVIYPDALEEEFANTEVAAIHISLLSINISRRGTGRRGLMLRRKNNNEYSRLGVFILDTVRLYKRANETDESLRLRRQNYLDRFDGCEPQKITII